MKNKIDIVVLFLSARADFGGGPEHIWQLLKYMPPFARACVACPRDYPYYARFSSLVGDANMCLLPHRAFSLTAVWRLCVFCKQSGVTVIHSHGKGAGAYGRLLALLTGLPCVHTFHGVHMGSYTLLQKYLYRGYERCMGLLTRAGVAVSRGERHRILEEGLISATKLCLTPNGVEIPAMEHHALVNRPFTIVSITRFDYQKNSLFLLEVLQHLKHKKRLDDFLCVLVGDGPEKAAMQAQADAQGLSGQICFMGTTPTPSKFFLGALCYFSSSRWEGMPLAVLEAMAYGLPPVLSNVVGNRDAVTDEKTGLLYAAGNAKDAAEAICRLADDLELRNTLGRQARAFIERKHDVRSMANLIWRILKKSQDSA